METESYDYDFQWQCDLFYFEKDRQDVYAWKLPASFGVNLYLQWLNYTLDKGYDTE